MSLFENPENLLLLQNLLNPKENTQQDDSDLEDEEESLIKKQINPGSIGSQPPFNQQNTKKIYKNSPYAPLETNTSKEEKEPESLGEWQQRYEEEDKPILDTRKCPTYKLTYRQAVGPEDVFLQMSNRTNATASCEDLLLEIHLPDDDTPTDKMQLTITEREIELSTPIHHLKLPLVHEINVDRCRAKYISQEHKLTLLLRLKRELDFINF